MQRHIPLVIASTGCRLLWCLLMLGLVTTTACVQGEEPTSIAKSAANQAADAPVILLTGFEPFDGASQNPSWEGIKKLDGTKWEGYQLVCKEIPVVWGTPQQQIETFISQLHPVAIFSFGQGRKDGFTIETVASNWRANYADNNGQKPSRPDIVKGGPDKFQASIDATFIETAVAEKGFPIRLSRSAGAYLCEEMLYTLEYLRSKTESHPDVMFCHVPPLETSLNGKVVDAAYVQNFVQTVLVAWQQAQEDDRRPEVRQLIETYFSSWSKQEMDTYGKCFATGATIQFISPEGRVSASNLQPFLAGQRDVHRNSPFRMVETPESIDIRFDEQLAKVSVFWKLISRPGVEEYGYDHFTLQKTDAGWRIVNLIYYKVDPPKKR